MRSKRLPFKHEASEPQKTQALSSTVQPGLEHRPFSDEEIKEAPNPLLEASSRPHPAY